jgi:hypothetical protein
MQAAELTLPPALLSSLVTPEALERVATAYWGHLTGCFLGLVRGRPAPGGPVVVLLGRRCVLLRFGAAHLRVDDAGGSVGWPITGGLLAARGAPPGDARFEIAIDRGAPPMGGAAHATVRVTVSGYRPALAEWLSPRFYMATQARVHVAVTHGYLRSLAWRLSGAGTEGAARRRLLPTARGPGPSAG